MRHEEWFDLEKKHSCGINYHSGKANVVIDALIHKSQSKLVYSITQEDKLYESFEKINLEIIHPPKTIDVCGAVLAATPNLREMIINTHRGDETTEKFHFKIRPGDLKEYHEVLDNAV